MNLTKDCIFKIGLVSGLALLGCIASAQPRINNGASQSTGISVRIGTFLPLTTEGTDIGHEWFAAGLDYKLSSSGSNPAQLGVLPTYLSISLDYVTKNDYNEYPLVLNYNVKQKAFVYTVGVGAVETQVSGRNTNATTSLTFQGGITYDFIKKPIPVFLQAKYMWSNYESFRGIGVFLGARF